MNRSIGRVTEPTTQAGRPDARDTDSAAPHLVRDILPSGRYDDTGIIDLDDLQRSVDPLDPRKPGRENGDPLDPYGHAI